MLATLFPFRRSSRRSPKPYRPALELFEKRALLSTVTTFADSGPGSLREAIALAEPGETIDFDPALAGGTILLTSGQLRIDKDLYIEGLGQDQLTVNGNGVVCGTQACDRRVFDVAYGANVTLAGLTIAGGKVVSPFTIAEDIYVFGGGIYNAGTLTLTDCTVSGNLAHVRANNNTGRLITANAYGGGLFNSGTAIVTRSTFVDNVSTMEWSITGNSRMDSDGYGGAIDNAGTLLLVDSTIGAANRPNVGVGYGGGLHNTGLATVSGSTFFNNDAPNGAGGNIPGLVRYSYGGAIANIRGTLTVLNSTITGNAARNGVNSSGGLSVALGGGIYTRGELNLINTTVAGNRLTANGSGGAAGLGRGAGVYVDPSFPHGGRLGNTIVSNNSFFVDGGTATFTGPDVYGPFASRGNNLISRTDGSTGWVASDLTGTLANPRNAGLGALGNWGGLTQTIQLKCDSEAIDTGNSDGTAEWDQRGDGYFRVVGYYDPKTPAGDIGGYEVQSLEDCDPTSAPFDGGSSPGQGDAADLVAALTWMSGASAKRR